MSKIHEAQINADTKAPEGILGDILSLLGAGQKTIDPSSLINPIGMASMPFKSMRRLPQTVQSLSKKFMAADARQARMDQMGSAFDFLMEKLDSEGGSVNVDEAIKMAPEKYIKRVADDFNLAEDDAKRVIDRFLLEARSYYGE